MLVDEYRDTNSSHYLLVKLLVGKRAAFTVVGDDDQSIYAWRGAKPENLALLAQDFPKLKVIKLEQNYRSTGRILKAANQVIANNPHVFEKQLWSEHGYGDPIRVIRCRTEDHEAEKIAGDILNQHMQRKRPFKDFAVLYRGNHQSRLIELKLQHFQVPYKLSGGTSFFARAEIKDIMAYLRLVMNSDDDNAFLRIVNTPRRELGPTTLEKLGQYAQEREQFGKPISQHQVIRHKLVTARTKLQAAEHMLYHGAHLASTGQPCSIETSMAKLFVADTAVEIATTCQQVMGAYALSDAYDMERHVRDLLGMPIVGGSSDMQRNNLASLMRL